jgi:uncharacterized protein (DUF934 family)
VYVVDRPLGDDVERLEARLDEVAAVAGDGPRFPPGRG